MKKTAIKKHGKQLFFITMLSLICLALGLAQAQAAVQQTLGDLPIEGRYAVSAAIGYDQPGYHARMSGGAVEADNAGHGLTVRFSDAGVELGTGRQSFALRPVMWGYGEDLTALLPGVPQAVGNMVTAQRGAVSEWYVNGPLGLQQGFTITKQPLAGRGPLTIDMTIVGAKAGALDVGGRGVMLVNVNGGALYRYSGLMVRDADGRDAPAWLESKGDSIRICVDDTGMQYPLYIDPVIQAAKLTASDGAASDYFGCSVAVSGDIVVVGAFYDDISAKVDQGSAYVFVKPSGGWTGGLTESAKLTASDGAANDWFGCSVAVSDDIVVVGSPLDDISAKVDQGSAYVFVRPPSGWTGGLTESAKLTASDGAANDWFGYSVALNDEAVLVGAVKDDIAGMTEQGSAYLFVKPAGGWATTSVYTAKLAASDGAIGDHFGVSVALSGDTVAVAASDDDSSKGAVYIFVKPEGGWVTTSAYTAKLTASDGAASDYFGHSIAMSDATVVVGAYGHDIGANTEQGAAYVFVTPSSGWANTTQTAKLTASDGSANDWFGWSVAVSGDTVVVGAYFDKIGTNTYQGSAYVFVMPSAGWEGSLSEAAKLTALDGADSDRYGASVAVSSDTIVVGTMRDDIGANADQGSAYIFKIIADEPIFQATHAVFTNVTANSMTVSWTPGTGTGSIVLMKQGSAVDGIPADGIDYTANSAFGSGAQIGTGNYVIYSGSGDTVTVTGLSPATTYHVAVYDYSSSPPSEAVNYRQTRHATASQSTSAAVAALAAIADNYTTPKNKTLVVEAPGVLANDTGTDNGSMLAFLVTEPANGTLSLGVDGSFIYIPDKRFKGTDNFTYKVSDGRTGRTESTPAKVTITVGKKCPAARMYGEDSPQVVLLRRYRDEVLEKTVAGKLVIDLYYGLAPAVERILENPWLQEKARGVVDGLLPVVEKQLK